MSTTSTIVFVVVLAIGLLGESSVERWLTRADPARWPIAWGCAGRSIWRVIVAVAAIGLAAVTGAIVDS